ncbi:MAG: hypothetical protein IT230_08130 [Flavobacteriales bacterium]|nr:hypothetical protein [Flavobacteriales bacterium]
MRYLIIPGIVLLFSAWGCTPSPPQQARPADTPPAVPRAAGSDSLLATMGPLQGKVVAVFYGDQTTWDLLGAGARVLAVVDNTGQAASMEARKQKEGYGDDRLIIRRVAPGAVGLLPNEADMALITREFSTLGNRPEWFRQLMAGTKAPHLFYLVNYFPTPTPSGPPMAQRMDFNRVADEVTQFGFGDVGIYYKKLPDRFILFGAVPAAMPAPGE